MKHGLKLKTATRKLTRTDTSESAMSVDVTRKFSRTGTTDSVDALSTRKGTWRKLLVRAVSNDKTPIQSPSPRAQLSHSAPVGNKEIPFSRESEVIGNSPTYRGSVSSQEEDEFLSPLSPLIQIQGGNE